MYTTAGCFDDFFPYFLKKVLHTAKKQNRWNLLALPSCARFSVSMSKHE